MARVTADELALVISNAPTDPIMEAFIGDASLWVDTHLVGACTALTAAVLKAVEKYLAAHYLSMRYPVLKSAKVGDTQDTFQVAGDDEVTPYLRAAAGLDPCGIVQDLLVAQKHRTAGKAYIGAGYVSTGGAA